MPMPDLRTFFRPFRTSARTTAADGRHGRLRRPVAMGLRSAMRLRRRTRGSALVLALMGGLIALIGALVLASRLFSSRFNSFSRSDTLAAREAAEYGLNQIQARLNTNEFGYLWVTKKDEWGQVSRDALTDCRVSVLDANGEELDALPALPAELALSAPRQVQSAGGTTITYELTGFEPPRLPDSDAATVAQEDFCGDSESGANFGNLNGGSALITVTGTVTRGNNTTTFKLSRRALVASAASSAGSDLVASFIILGNAYKGDKKTGLKSFGADSDVTQLRSADGNICYGNSSSPSCFNPDLPKTVIGCFDLGSCLINNVDLDDKTREKNCQDIQPKEKGKKKTKTGFTCNDFQQIDDLPSVPLPQTSGFVISGSAYKDSNWKDYSAEYDCEAKEYNLPPKTFEWKCKVKGAIPKVDKTYERVRFPYLDNTTLPADRDAALQLSNSDLIPGCYFSHVDASKSTSKADKDATQAINCLVDKLQIDNKDKLANLVVYTANGGNQLLPVNIFLHGKGGSKDEIVLEKGGIQGSDVSQYGWNRLRILGKPQATADGDPVACDVSTQIKSKGSKSNDLDNLFLWLPNSSLIYDKKGTKENSFAVIWVCEFTGPKKDGDNKFSIITPFPEEVARSGVVGIDSKLGSSFITVGGGVYRGFGSEDSPAS